MLEAKVLPTLSEDGLQVLQGKVGSRLEVPLPMVQPDELGAVPFLVPEH